jgi:hypothetical protein
LVLLENAGQHEQISFAHGLTGCQIEHIMPQTLGAAWQGISDHEHQRHLHKLGNLSITFDNAALGNLGFPEKKCRLAELSRVRLNQMLLDYESFGPEEIRDRATRLLDRFFAAYNIPAETVGHDNDISDKPSMSPQQWLNKVRGDTAPELAALPFANTWSAICKHLLIPVGQDSAHRRLQIWIEIHRPTWPSTRP